jgi:hypothetical protein
MGSGDGVGPYRLTRHRQGAAFRERAIGHGCARQANDRQDAPGLRARVMQGDNMSDETDREKETSASLAASLATLDRRKALRAAKISAGEFKEETEATPSAQTQRPLQLPMWPDPVRGAPNTLLRSAFFTATHKERKELGTRKERNKPKEGVLIAAQEGIRITYAGDELNQYDASVFFEAAHRARLHPLATECIFTGYSFLKAIGCAVTSLNYEDLDDSLNTAPRRSRDHPLAHQWAQIKIRRGPDFHIRARGKNQTD